MGSRGGKLLFEHKIGNGSGDRKRGADGDDDSSIHTSPERWTQRSLERMRSCHMYTYIDSTTIEAKILFHAEGS